MTQLTKEEIILMLKDLDEKLSPEDKLELLKELNNTVGEMNNDMEEFVEAVKENT